MSGKRVSETRRDILRQVYHSNLDGVEAGPARRDPRPSPRQGRRLRYLRVLFVLPLLLLWGYSLDRNLAQHPSSPVHEQTGLLTDSVAELVESFRGAAGVASAPAGTIVGSHEPIEAPAPQARRAELSYLELTRAAPLPLAELFGLDVHTIVVDPGHGGRDPGASGPSGLAEKEVTLDVALRLRDQLRRSGRYRVLLTREQDESVSLRERVDFANAQGADLFVSLHLNALPVAEPTVVETYYFGAHSDEMAREVARAENRGSGYGLGEFRAMIEKLGDSLKYQESRRLARLIQGRLYRRLREENRDIVSWGVKSAPFVVLLGVDMPSVLAELTTLSNPREEQRLKRDAYREKIAATLAASIADYLNQVPDARGPLTGAHDNGNESGKKVKTEGETPTQEG